jgi:pimeloyl-ACP methyl ester carboxylesterase
VRQREVARLALLVLALASVVPVVRASRVLLIAALFLTEFLTAGAWPALTRLASAPAREPLPVRGALVDRYLVPARTFRTPLVLVHGLAPDGKDDARLVAAAALLARAGFDVVVPTIPGLTQLRLRPEDVRPVVATLAAQQRPAVVVGVSVGAGVAMLAAAQAEARAPVRLVLSLGGYASAAELVRFYLTGEFEFGDARGRAAHDPALIETFVRANPDLLDASARRVLAAADLGAVDASLQRLSPDLRALFDALSPERVVRSITAPLLLVHGRDDVAVPYTESLRLAAVRPDRTRLVLVGVVGHVEGADVVERWSAVRDVLALWTATYRLLTLACTGAMSVA